MVVFPRAKINIGLRITGKRDDGFHDIETLFFPLPFSDALEFVRSDKNKNTDSLSITGIDPGGNKSDNLVIKAIERLRRTYSIPYLKIHLHKVIPAGAGLGGGSSDAAFIMTGINRIFRLGINCQEMRSVAMEIGSDCPFFIDPVPSLATGRGEILVPLGKPLLENHYMMLLNPGIHVSTREAYQNCRPSMPEERLGDILNELPVERWKEKLCNDFEEYVFKKHPSVKKIKDELYSAGAVFSMMSGSGSSVYGIFKTRRIVPARLKKHIIWQGYL